MMDTEYTRGTKKLYWNDVKDEFHIINPDLYQLIEPLSDKDDLPLYLCTFSWGELIGDEKSQFIPQEDGTTIKLSLDSLSYDYKENLGYGAQNSPVGMFFRNNFEWFIDLPEKKLTLPYRIYTPGDFFAYTKILGVTNDFNYAPMGIFKGTAGARSCFMLPPVSYKKKLDKMFSSLKVRGKQPTSLYDHNNLFQKILSSPEIKSNWSASILYFSEGWIRNIQNSKGWSEVKNYFFRLKSKNSSYRFNAPIYNAAYSLTLEKINRKPNPYLFDTFKHIIDIASGEVPGFAPQTESNLIPINELQRAFVDFYGLEYSPTLLAPQHFNLSNILTSPCYYSLNFPTTFSFSPSSAKLTRTAEMRDFIDIYEDLKDSLCSSNSFCSDTIIEYIFNKINFSFYHTSENEDNRISPVINIINNDPSFSHKQYSNMRNNLDAPFFKGCVKINFYSD